MQAILITAYKNIDHLIEIIRFFHDGFSVYIHIDKKSTLTKDQIKLLDSYKNVSYVSQKYEINWGGFNHLRAILDLSEKALEEKENTYFHLITGHDYPIKSITDFKQFENTRKIFMEYHPMPYNAWEDGGLDRLEQYNFYDFIDGREGIGESIIKKFGKLQKAVGFKRKFYKNFPSLYGGSTYWSMSREALKYVFEYLHNNPQFLNRFKYTFCSEEIFFQTILLNSEFKENIVNNNKRFIVWEKRNGNYPANLDLSDFENIEASDALFARKFEYPVSSDLFDKIKSKLTH